MKKLEISESNARKLYKDMPDFRASLEDTFGKAFFSGKITDRIKTYEDACAELGEQPVNEAELKRLGFADDELDYRKIKTITKALNEGWQADWSDEDQYKWYPWFRFSSGSFRFYGTDFQRSTANAGSARAFASPRKNWQNTPANSFWKSGRRSFKNKNQGCLSFGLFLQLFPGNSKNRTFNSVESRITQSYTSKVARSNGGQLGKTSNPASNEPLAGNEVKQPRRYNNSRFGLGRRDFIKSKIKGIYEKNYLLVVWWCNFCRCL